MLQNKSSIREDEYFKKEIHDFEAQVGSENEMLYNNTIFYSLFFRSRKLCFLNRIYSEVDPDSLIYQAYYNFKLIKI